MSENKIGASFHRVKRRAFLGMLGEFGVVVAGRQAQASSVPVVGFLHGRSPSDYGVMLQAFREGLRDSGFVEGRTVAIRYAWAEGDVSRLPKLAAGLAQASVSVIVAGGGIVAVRAAMEATKRIPIVALFGPDPAKAGLIASLSRPGGNVTGVGQFADALELKRLEMLHELLPAAVNVAYFGQPPAEAEKEGMVKVGYGSEWRSAAKRLGLEVHFIPAPPSGDFESALASVGGRVDAMLVMTYPSLINASAIDALLALARKPGLPTVFGVSQAAEAGALMSYGASIPGIYREMGACAARILKGESPAEMPVLEPTKFDFVINLKTAKSLGVDVPPSLLALASKVIE